MLTEDHSTLTSEALSQWFQTFQTNIKIDEDNLRCLTSNSNLQDIWQEIIRHCHPIDFVKKVKETIRINELKERHPDRWEQHKNAQIQQGQIEQRISIRLREIYSARSEQSTNIFNELNRLETLIQDEYSLLSSFDKQLQIYQQLLSYLKQLALFKDKFSLFTSNHRSNHQELLTQLTSTKLGKIEDSTNLIDLCSVLSTLVQQRINQLNKIEKDEPQKNSLTNQTYEEALTKANLDFTKQFVHLSNIRHECAKIRQKLEETKREVLSRRSNNEQIQLISILNTMIANKSIEFHISLLKKKIQSELEQINKNDQKQVSRIHQQINDKRFEINKIDQQLNQIIQLNPFEILEKLEFQIREYIRILTEFPSKIHSLNLNHLSLSNELQANILNWSNEQFARLNLNQNSMESSPIPLLIIPSQTPTTPLTSLKQLLGIKTQDTSILEPILTSETNGLSKQDYQHWDIDLNEDEILKITYPIISSIDWQMLTSVDKQMEQALVQAKLDFTQYDQFFQNLIKEIRVLQYERKEKPAFHS